MQQLSDTAKQLSGVPPAVLEVFWTLVDDSSTGPDECPNVLELASKF